MCGTRSARAQQIALSHFDPAFAGDRLIGVPSAFAPGPLTFHGMVLGDYARYPLLERRVNDGEPVAAVVRGQLFLHLNATFSYAERVAFNIDVPAAVFQSGDLTESPEGADLGDVRLGVRGAFFGSPGAELQLGAGAHFWLPTGTGTFVTDGFVRGLPYLVVGGQSDPVAWSFAAGAEIRPSQEISGVPIGSQLYAAGGVGLALGAQRAGQIGLETSLFVNFDRPSADNINSEILVHGKVRFLDFLEAGAAVGPGIGAGIGTPAARVVFSLAYTPRLVGPPPDSDGDGIPDASDACRIVQGLPRDDPAQNGCPPVLPRDTDGDGVPDVSDACSEEAGVPQGDESKNGCPIDPADEAALLAKLEKPRPGDKGDADGDGIPNDADACPEEKGKAAPSASKNGCPSLVRVTDVEIVLLNEVHFESDEAALHRVAKDLLDQVAEVLLQHPEIVRVEVQGHTDSRGTLAHNERLAKARADSVRDALVHRSIAPSRLVTKGVGPVSPADTNLTAAGRQRNRRVQFRILEKKSAAAPGEALPSVPVTPGVIPPPASPSSPSHGSSRAPR